MCKTDSNPQQPSALSEQREPLAAAELAFSEEDYALVWQSFLDAVGEANFFSGKIHTAHSGFCSELTISVIIYRDREQDECPICDIVPIWWQMTTYVTNDDKDELCEECPNDFEFRNLREVCKES